MQQQMFDDLCQLLPELAELQAKISYLISLKKKLQNDSVEIEITIKDFEGSLMQQTITQSFIPYNLRLELQILLNNSIDEYQRVYLNLCRYMNDFNRLTNK